MLYYTILTFIVIISNCATFYNFSCWLNLSIMSPAGDSRMQRVKNIFILQETLFDIFVVIYNI